ncbi:MAG: DNA mismatch repair protein MutS, partial [Bacteroidetes bacterium]|nr:DNA mismatch repair protein MutS [Bacteroidota bacterium]
RAGQRVAICDQLEDPKMTKTIVKRGVTELVTPGVSFNDQVLEQGKNNFVCALFFGKKSIGIAFLDISTGEFLVAQGDKEYTDKLISSFEPTELIFQKNKTSEFKDMFGDEFYTFRMEDWVFTSDFASDILTKQFGTASLKGFGVEGLEDGVIASGAILHYLNENKHTKLGHITALSRIEEEKYVWLDRFTIRNLELVYSVNDNAITLAQILDQTSTPMGGRLLKRWMVLPLKDRVAVEERLEIVDYLFSHQEVQFELTQRLKEIGDLERLVSKVAVGKINPREIAHLKKTLCQIPPLKELLESNNHKSMVILSAQLNTCAPMIELITRYLYNEPAAQIGKGQVIAEGVDMELDELRNISLSGKDYLEKLQNQEAERTGIPSLKISFNNVFGYYIEVRNTHKDKVPMDWIRKQTLVNAERYITEELKSYEAKILGAEEKIFNIETALYQQLVLDMASYVSIIQGNARAIAKLDCLCSFASVASSNNYCKPKLHDGYTIDIKNGRHPVIEKRLPAIQEYIPNDVFLDNESQQIIMITGPNMSGKSAILRQTALIVLMAQMGSFVPAESAVLGMTDKVFTRVGASDNISLGESTFMVEMNETASILNNISSRSLILLDEIGRGTSTYDGISIAWAIAEYLHEFPRVKCKTLFATHYHELNEMTKHFERIRNFNVSVKETKNNVLFLRKLQPGGSHHSFGIYVAKMAGMPPLVVQRAEEVLRELERTHSSLSNGKHSKNKRSKDQQNMQLSFFQLNDPVLEQIHEELMGIDINTLTPVEALMKLNEIKKLTGG